MANILIIGDSWGISPFWTPKTSQAEPFTEYRLFQLGHTVWNRSIGGNQNLGALRDCDMFLKNVQQYINFELIIWFHTEMVRDIHLYRADSENKNVNIPSLTGQLEYVRDATYQVARDIKRDYPAIKWAIVGGHAPLWPAAQLDWADYLVEDWRSDILGEKMPLCHTLSGLSWLQGHIKEFGVKNVQRELDNYETIVKACGQDEDKFYDGIHPAGKYHKQLADSIHRHFFANR